MTIDNIALVRATNVIPFDGVMRPISEEQYLTKNVNLVLSQGISDMLKEEGIIPEFDYSKCDDDNYISEYNRELKKILSDYIPYNSDYNSVILFSLNGIVPDDSEVSFGNNTFSNKKCAIIDGLSEHIDQVVSLMPTDTAVKGSIPLSENAICLIEKDYYDSLPMEEKNKLMSNNFEIKCFTGDLKTAVNEALRKTGKYIPEDLSLSRKDQGYRDSETKGELINTINSIASDRNIAQVLYFDILTGKNDDMDKLDSVKDEYEKILLVNDYYSKQFLDYLFDNMSIDEELQEDLTSNMYAMPYIKKLCDEIKRLGIDNYKKVVEEYNKNLENQKMKGELLTPDEIVNQAGRNR